MRGGRTLVSTDAAPAAAGAYSQGVGVGWSVHFSGQVGIDPATGALLPGFDAQLGRVLANIDGLLSSQGLGRGDVVKTTVFLTDMGDFAKVNEAYRSFFREPFPARSCVEVSGLPLGALVEIEVLAARP